MLSLGVRGGALAPFLLLGRVCLHTELPNRLRTGVANCPMATYTNIWLWQQSARTPADPAIQRVGVNIDHFNSPEVPTVHSTRREH